MAELRELGRYEILERIGSGGMAVVYRARQRDLDRLVALKELSLHRGGDGTWASRFLRESRLTGSLTHANIVTVYDYFEAGGTPYIAMEYVERGSLRPLVRSMTTAQIGGVLAQLLAGLGHAERRGIVHRDLKPENLLVTTEGQVKIADFGIAKATSEVRTGSFNTEAGMTVGTPGYMSPEQAMARDIGPWSDLYSVGCMAYELFVGHLPFPDVTDPLPLMLRHISEPIPAARAAAPSLEPSIADWVDSLLVKDWQLRPGSAQEAWEPLEEILYDVLGPRWQRQSALVDVAPDLRLPHMASALLPSIHISPFTPPPASAAISAELWALDPTPDSFVTFTPPERAARVSTESPAVAPQALVPEPEPPALVPDPAGATTRVPAPRFPTDAVQPPLPPVRPRRRVDVEPGGRRRRPYLAGVGVVVVAGVIVAVIAGGSSPPKPPAPTPSPTATAVKLQPVDAGKLSFSVPANWTSRPGSGSLKLGLSDATSAGPQGSGIAAGFFGSVTSALLPADLAKGQARSEVKVGALDGYRYTDVDGATVYVFPTDAGVAALACDQSAASNCDSVARTLKLDGATPLPLGADPRFAAAVNAAVGGFNHATGARSLPRARTRGSQHAAAGAIGASLDKAAKPLERYDAHPGDAALGSAVLKAIDGTASGYARMQGAATRTGWNAGASTARSQRGKLAAALGELRKAGYTNLTRPASLSIPAFAKAPVKHEAVVQSTPVATATPRPNATAVPTPAPTYSAPRPTATAKPKPTPVPIKPTPVPIGGN